MKQGELKTIDQTDNYKEPVLIECGTVGTDARYNKSDYTLSIMSQNGTRN